MQKASWTIKRPLNQMFYHMRHVPGASHVMTDALRLSRQILRLGRAPSADLGVEKILDVNGQFVYLANPKVATRSVLGYFEQHAAHRIRIVHQSTEALVAQQPQVADSFVFSFVRNPWARVFSCWQDKISTRGKFCDISIVTRFPGLYPDMPFADFVAWLCSDLGQDCRADRHWISQYRLLGGENCLQRLGFIGKCEHLQDDFAHVARELAIGPERLGEQNVGASSGDYRQHYTDITAAQVAERYARDIQLFNYSF